MFEKVSFQSTLESRDRPFSDQYCVNHSTMLLPHKKIFDCHSYPFVLIFGTKSMHWLPDLNGFPGIYISLSYHIYRMVHAHSIPYRYKVEPWNEHAASLGANEDHAAQVWGVTCSSLPRRTYYHTSCIIIMNRLWLVMSSLVY